MVVAWRCGHLKSMCTREFSSAQCSVYAINAHWICIEFTLGNSVTWIRIQCGQALTCTHGLTRKPHFLVHTQSQGIKTLLYRLSCNKRTPIQGTEPRPWQWKRQTLTTRPHGTTWTQTYIAESKVLIRNKHNKKNKLPCRESKPGHGSESARS